MPTIPRGWACSSNAAVWGNASGARNWMLTRFALRVPIIPDCGIISPVGDDEIAFVSQARAARKLAVIAPASLRPFPLDRLIPTPGGPVRLLSQAHGPKRISAASAADPHKSG